MRTIGAGLLAAAAVLGLGACSSSTTNAPGATAAVGDLHGKTPSEILAAAAAAANRAGSAHYVMTAHQGSQVQTIAGDASASQAQQSVTQGTQHIQVTYVGGVAYVQGNAAGLHSAMGLSTGTAAKFAGTWIAIHNGDALYSSIVQAVSLSSTVAQLAPTGTLTLTAPTTIAGRQAVGVRGGLPGPSQSGVTGSTTLYVSAASPTVPLRFVGDARQGSQRVRDEGTFSNWGRPLHLDAPGKSVPFSSLPTS